MAGNPWANFSGQCVGWVRAVEPWIPGGPANAYQYASDGTLQNVGARQVNPADAQVGDVVVWPAGIGNSDSGSGHIAVVSQVLSNGVQVSQANWDEKGDPTVMAVPQNVLQNLNVYAPPVNQQQTSAARAMISAIGLRSANLGLTGSAGAATTPSSGTTAQLASDTTSTPSTAAKLWYGTAFIPDGPYIHTLWKMSFTAGALLMIYLGVHLLRGEGISLPKMPFPVPV